MNQNCYGASLDDLVERLDKAEKQRDELIEVVEILIIGACGVGVPHPGERKVLQEAVTHARKFLDVLKGGA